MTIRNQTVIIGICSIIIFLILISNLLVPSLKEEKKSIFDKSIIITLLIFFFIILPLILVKLYAVNCMLEGNCDGFVWFLVLISILITLFYIFLFVKKIYQLKQKNHIDQEMKHA